MAACPTCTSLRCMEQGRLGNYVHPVVTIRPRSAHARVFGLGAGRAAARGCIIPDNSGSEGERAAGGPGLEPPMLSGRGAPTRSDGGGTRIHTMDMDGARRRSHEPTAVRPELGLGWPESTHRWTGTSCRAASLDCSEWSEERVAGRARLDWVEGGDSRRTGPTRSRTKMQDVGLEVGHGLCQQTTLTELFRNDT
jgi:hypothetical protein